VVLRIVQQAPQRRLITGESKVAHNAHKQMEVCIAGCCRPTCCKRDDHLQLQNKGMSANAVIMHDVQ
jgi:hypothetical protein